jgi:hypothetical protein
MSSPHVISAIPLEPSPRIIGMYPSLLYPYSQWLTSIYAEEIQRRFMPILAEFSTFIPIGRKLMLAICHVFPSEYPEM